MKSYSIITGILLFIGLSVAAQENSEEALNNHYHEFPDAALRDADSLYRIGIKKKNNVLVLKSLILRSHFTIKKDYDQYPQQIQHLEGIIQKEKDVAMRSLLHSYVGELYSRFYSSNLWTIKQRTPLTGEVPADIKQWSSNQFDDKINEHLRASIKAQEVLQKTPANIYDAIFIKGAASDSLRPTLYDFLCQRFLRLASLMPKESDFAKACPPELYGNAETFVHCTLPSDCSNELRVYQQLLTFRLREKETAPAALIWADLERIRCVNRYYSYPARKQWYLQRLEKMAEEYAGHPLVVEVLAEFAEQLHDQAYREKQDKQKELMKKVLSICEEGIQKYGSYPRIDILKHLINRIKESSASINFPEKVYPGEPFEIKVTYRNASQLQVDFLRLPNNTQHYKYAWRFNDSGNPSTPWKQIKLQLQSQILQKDTVIRINHIPSGIYAVQVRGKHFQKTIPKVLVSTSLFGILLSDGKTARVQVVDANSGFPVANAKVSQYTPKRGEYRRINDLTTDHEGFADFKWDGRSEIYYRITNQDNPSDYIYNFDVWTGHSSKCQEEYTTLMTDRAIYRPGETIYFKGYCWTATRDTLYANQHTNQEVTLEDPNAKIVSSVKVNGNSFGTFTGSFVLPTDAMNGSYVLCSNRTYHHIQVADYKRPEFEIKLEIPQQRFHGGDTIRVKGKAISYSGMNIANTMIRYKTECQSYSNRFEERIIQDSVVYTDSRGEFEIECVTENTSSDYIISSRFQYYHITVTLTDNKGETQESTIRIPIDAGKACPKPSVNQYINKLMPAVFHVELSDYSPDRAHKVRYCIEKLVSPWQERETKDTLIEKRIAEGERFIQKGDSVVLQLQNEASGAYLFTTECNGKKAKRIFYLYSPEDKRPPITTDNWLIEEKTACRNGEKTRISFGTSLKPVYLQYELFSNNKSVLRKSMVVSDTILPIEITYLPEYADNIKLHITYVKDKKYLHNEVHLTRIKELPQLKIETNVFRDRLVPGQEEEWQLHITQGGDTAFAEVLALMYDSSLDKIVRNELYFKAMHLTEANRIRQFAHSISPALQYISLYPKESTHANISIPNFNFNVLNLYEESCVYYVGSSLESMKKTLNTRAENSIVVTGQGPAAPSESDADLDNVAIVSAPIQLREDFRATAFFYPQLQTDSAGMVNIRFTVPDALTRWKFVALATTQDMNSTKIERTITTSKPLMVRPNLPRFLRNKDKAEIKAVVSNLSDSVQAGTVSFELLIPGTEEVLVRRDTTFRMDAKGNSNVGFTFEVPSRHPLVVCRIVARGTDFCDGEQQYLPIVSNEILVNHTLPIFVNKAGKHTFSLKEKDAGKRNYRLTLEMTANPIWYAVQALPTLQQPAHECVTDIVAAYYVNAVAARIAAENPTIAAAIRQWQKRDKTELESPLSKNPELKSILLEATPWALEAQSETERMRSLAKLFDKNRLEYLQNQVIQKLAGLQTGEGGWSWFKNMPASRFMTMNVLTAMQRVSTYAQRPMSEQEKRMQVRAIQYLDREIVKQEKKKSKYLGYLDVLYLYVRSLYSDIPLGEALESHKHLMGLAKEQWGRMSFYEKALMAIIFQHYGFKKEATELIESLRQYAVVTPEYGMYWPNNRNFFFCNSAIQTHTAILEAFAEINGNNEEIGQMQQWLLRQKEVQNWGSVPSTVDAIHALLLGDNCTLTNKEKVTIKMGPHTLSTADTENIPGYLKATFAAEEISSGMLKAEVHKQTDTPSWGGMYLQSFQELDRIEAQEGILKVGKKLYTERINAKGKKELVPVEGAPLKIGDKVVVRLTVTAKQDMQYLHLRDLRAACFEPTEQLSGYEYGDGVAYYKEVKDACTNFFFDFLPRGTYVFEYSAWVNRSGIYQDGIATLQSVYAPAYNSNSEATTVRVKE